MICNHSILYKKCLKVGHLNAWCQQLNSLNECFEQCFLFKFFNYVHWLGSSTLINNKWWLSWWISRFFWESYLVLATYKNTMCNLVTFKPFLSRYGEWFFKNLKIPFVGFANPFVLLPSCKNSPKEKTLILSMVINGGGW